MNLEVLMLYLILLASNAGLFLLYRRAIRHTGHTYGRTTR